MIQRIKKYFGQKAAQQMVEHMDDNQSGFFLERVWQDHLLRYDLCKKYVAGKTVLDLACGEGYGTQMLSAVAKKVTGVDLSAETIVEAQKKYAHLKNLKYIAAEGIHYLEKDSKKYDVIISFETVEHIAEYQKFLTLLRDRLKPGGKLILSTPNKEFSDLLAGDTFNPFHVHEFYTKELSDLLTEIFSEKPELFQQRPVSTSWMIPSIFQVFVIKKESSIEPANPQKTAMDNIFISTYSKKP